MGTHVHRQAARAALVACLFVAFTTAAAPAAAQPSLDVTFGRALNTLTTSERQTTGGTVDIQQKLADERLRLFYSFEGGDFSTPGDWAYYSHDFGATWRAREANGSRPSVFAGISGVWRTNGTSWEAADYAGVGFFLNAEWKPSETKTIRAGYRVDVRRFRDLSVLDHAEHEGFGSLLVNLPSRTTLIAEARAGIKQYEVLGAFENTAAVADSTVVAPASVTLGTGHGRGIGAMARTSGYVVSAPGSHAASVVGGTAGQVTVLGRLAQSLADRAGITLQYLHRASFGALPTAVITTPAQFFDDGVYDDPFASTANAARASAKQLLRNGMELEAFCGWTRKDYRGTLALDVEGMPTTGLRVDRIARVGAAWTVPLFREKSGPMDMGLVFDYQFIRHRSNDAFYNYTSHGVGMSLTASY